MSVAAQNPLLNSRFHHLCFYSNHIHIDSIRTHISTFTIPTQNSQNPLPNPPILNPRPSIPNLNPHHRWSLRVFESSSSEGEVQKQDSDYSNKFNVDAFLSIAEVVCLAPSAVFSIGCAVNWAFSTSSQLFEVSVVNKVFVWQFVFLVGAVFIGTLIRRRQWGRVYVKSNKPSGLGINVIDRIEKLEEDLRSSATIIRVMSRQLEKLGIRFRVTRKALKGPISETAALAQKNSEATRALAAHEDNLEKELGEIQKVLLAMQEQQQKQLELILAVLKAGKPRENKQHEPVAEEDTRQKINSVAEKKPAPKQMGAQIQTGKRHDIERVN